VPQLRSESGDLFVLGGEPGQRGIPETFGGRPDPSLGSHYRSVRLVSHGPNDDTWDLLDRYGGLSRKDFGFTCAMPSNIALISLAMVLVTALAISPAGSVAAATSLSIID
jgi:hypothetical protein